MTDDTEDTGDTEDTEDTGDTEDTEDTGDTGDTEDTGDSEAMALVDALASCSFVVMGVLTRIAAENDMSLTQLRTLGILRDRRPRMAQLAEFLGLDRSTMSGLIERAEGRGLVRRVPNAEDRRAVDVEMTEAGLELADVLAADVREALAPITERIDPAKRAMFVGELTRMLRPGDPRP